MRRRVDNTAIDQPYMQNLQATMMASFSRLVVILIVVCLTRDVSSFSTKHSDGVLKLPSTQNQRLSSSSPRSSKVLLMAQSSNNDGQHEKEHPKNQITTGNTRRSILQKVISTSAILSTSLLAGGSSSSMIANAAMGTLPEFEDTNAIFQGITIDVTDKAQYEETIQFFTNGFDGMKVLRERGGDGGSVVRDTVSRWIMVLFCLLVMMY